MAINLRPPIDIADFEPRPATPVRSRSSPDKKPICSGFSSPTSSSPFTPVRKHLLQNISSSPSIRPSISRPPSLLNNHPLSPLRAPITADAIPRKRPLLPGAPNPASARPPSFIIPAPPKLLSPFTSASPTPVLLPSPQDHPNSPHQESVQVSVRIRAPVSPQDPPSQAWSIDEREGKITDQHGSANPPAEWNFDAVFGPLAPNELVYRQSGARNLILSAMAGYDATIFAYGQTASGKTYTLTGTPQQPGIIPLSVQEIFAYIRTHPDRDFLLRVSYLEIYNEHIHDLLHPSNISPPPVRIRQQAGAFFAAPVREELVTSVSQAAALLVRGEAQRHVAGTDWNARSSRSHTVFGIVVESRLAGLQGAVRRSKVCLIDLAGNERATSEAERRSEGAFINKSLLTLEKVISALSEPAKRRPSHIPFRDSKLTQLLQPSLAGRARVCVLCTVDGAPRAVETTRSTLRFASRVKRVETSAGVQEIVSEGALITRYRSQIVELQNQLVEAMKKASQAPPTSSDTIPVRASDDDDRTRRAAEERERIKRQLKELEMIVLNARNVDEVRVGTETRAVSPVKKSSLAAESDESSEEEEEDGGGVEQVKDGTEGESDCPPDATTTPSHTPSAPSSSLPASDRVALQAHEIACLRHELASMGAVDENAALQAAQRVDESLMQLEKRFEKLRLEVERRKKFGFEVLELLDQARSKSRKLEMFVIHELERSTRRLSRFESRTRRRRSSSVGPSDLGHKVDLEVENEREEVQRLVRIVDEVEPEVLDCGVMRES